MTATLSLAQPMEERIRLKFTLGGLLLFSLYVRAVLAESQPIQAKIPWISLGPDCIRYAPHQYRRFYIDIDRTFEEYLKRFSAQRRSHWRRVVRNYARFCGGEITWREFSSPAEMREFHRLAREVSRMTYQEKLVDAGLPADPEFIAELQERAQRERVLGYILFHGDRPIAYQYCPVEDDVVVFERTGYRPDYAPHSPGMVLLYLGLERAFNSGRFQRFDFGKGEYPYKEALATGCRLCADMYYFRRTLTNSVVVAAHAALSAGWWGMAWMLDRFRLRQRLRKVIRTQYGR